MSERGGLTSSKHQEASCEFFRRGSTIRHIAYGATREDILAHLEGYFSGSSHETTWQGEWVVMPTKIVPMGLSRQWLRAPRGYDREYHMI